MTITNNDARLAITGVSGRAAGKDAFKSLPYLNSQNGMTVKPKGGTVDFYVPVVDGCWADISIHYSGQSWWQNRFDVNVCERPEFAFRDDTPRPTTRILPSTPLPTKQQNSFSSTNAIVPSPNTIWLSCNSTIFGSGFNPVALPPSGFEIDPERMRVTAWDFQKMTRSRSYSLSRFNRTEIVWDYSAYGNTVNSTISRIIGHFEEVTKAPSGETAGFLNGECSPASPFDKIAPRF